MRYILFLILCVPLLLDAQIIRGRQPGIGYTKGYTELETRNIISDSLTAVLTDEATAASGNLIKYPSFEEGGFHGRIGQDYDMLKYSPWAIINGITGYTLGMYFTTEESYHGDQSVLFVANTGSGNRGIETYTDISGSTQYTFSVYHKANATVDSLVDMRVLEKDVSENTLATHTLVITDSIGTSWSQDKITFTSNASAVNVNIIIRCDSYTGSDSVYFDAAALNTGASSYSWTTESQLIDVQNVYDPIRMSYLNIDRQAIFQAKNDSLLGPLAVFRMYGNTKDSYSPYRSMVEFQGTSGALWDSKVDQDGNIWVNYYRDFVTANKNGVSAGHFGNFGDDWTEINLGTTDGLVFTTNNTGAGDQVINYQQWNTNSNPMAMFYGTIGFGADAISRNNLVAAQADSETYKIDNTTTVKIDTNGLTVQNDGQLKINDGISSANPNPSGTIKINEDTLMWAWAGSWYYTVGTKIAYSTWTPASSSNLVWWYNTDSLKLTGSVVDTLFDKAGNGYDLKTLGSPVKTFSQKNMISGIRFDEVDDMALYPDTISAMENDQEFWVLTVFQVLDNNSESHFVFYKRGASRVFAIVSTGLEEIVSGYSNGTWSRYQTADRYINQWIIIKSHYDGSGTLDFTVNSDTASTSTSIASSSPNGLFFGARGDTTLFSDMMFMEAACVSDSADADAIYNYLLYK